MIAKTSSYLEGAVKSLRIADHMMYVTFPLVNEKKLLVKIFDEECKAIMGCINAVLNHERSEIDNIGLFLREYAKKYSLTNKQIKQIEEIIHINRFHKQSAMEFVKRNKVVIMSDSLSTEVLNERNVKEHLLLAKEFLIKVNLRLSND